MKEVGNLPVLEQVRSKVDGFKRTGKRPRDGCEWESREWDSGISCRICPRLSVQDEKRLESNHLLPHLSSQKPEGRVG